MRLNKEIYKLVEEVERLRFKRAVIDHPFSPFIDLSVEQMKNFRQQVSSFTLLTTNSRHSWVLIRS